MSEIALLPAHALAEAIRHREVSSRELLEHYLARVERLNPPLNAVVTMTLSVWIWRASADTVTASLSPPIASVPSMRSVAPAVSSMFSSVVVWKPFAVITIT